MPETPPASTRSARLATSTSGSSAAMCTAEHAAPPRSTVDALPCSDLQ